MLNLVFITYIICEVERDDLIQKLKSQTLRYFFR